MASRADGTDHVQTKSRSSYLDNGSLTSWRPHSSGVKIGPNSALIFKKYGRSKFLGSFLNLRKLGFFPMLHGFIILLIGSIQGLLTGKPQLPKQPTHRAFTQFDTKLPVNSNRNHRPGPKGKFKLHLKRIISYYGTVDPGDLSGSKLFGAARTGTLF